MSDARSEPAATPGPVVDWALAERTGVRLAPRGPAVPLSVAREAVAELAAHAAAATGHVADVTGLSVAAATSPVRVVERSAWVRANVAGLRELIDPVLTRAVQVRLERAEAKRSTSLAGRVGRLGRIGSDPRLALAAGSKVTGTEVGALLGWLSSRVLGQYDAFGPGGGQLLLVAPNVVAIERELGVDPRDFRLWVALHEETHRVQFAAAPWLADHLASRARGLSGDLLGAEGEAGPTDRVLALVRSLARPGGLAALRRSAVDGPDGVADPDDPLSAGLVSALAGPAQRRALAEVTAVMSLLEGHADVVMDEAGPSVIPSVAAIRARFSDRRASGRSGLDRVVRSLLGLDAKMRQYTDGARFVRAVVAEVGHEGLNQVWSGPQALPRPGEIARPRTWLDRVHG